MFTRGFLGPILVSKKTRISKETHLHRARGDSRLFDGTAWYLQSGVTISHAVVASALSSKNREEDSEDEPQLLAGTQTLKRSGFKRSQRAPKRLKDITPDDVVVESLASEAEDSNLDMSPSKQGKQQRGKQKGKQKEKKKKLDGWIWLERVTRGQNLGDDTKLAEYKRQSDRVQWFRAEAEMYRWLEQYERKHAELMRVIERFRRDSVVWAGLADREEQRNGGLNGSVTFARMQAAMYKHLEHNAKVIFKSSESGAHHDWVSATTFGELVTKIDGWRDVVFKWMDDMAAARRALGHPYLPPVLENRVGGVVVLVVVAQPPRLCTSVWRVLSMDGTQVWMVLCVAMQPHDIIYAPLKFASTWRHRGEVGRWSTPAHRNVQAPRHFPTRNRPHLVWGGIHWHAPRSANNERQGLSFPVHPLNFSLYPASTSNSDSPEEPAVSYKSDSAPHQTKARTWNGTEWMTSPRTCASRAPCSRTCFTSATRRHPLGRESEYVLRLLAARRPVFERAARADDIRAEAAYERAVSDAGVEGRTPSLPQRPLFSAAILHLLPPPPPTSLASTGPHPTSVQQSLRLFWGFSIFLPFFGPPRDPTLPNGPEDEESRPELTLDENLIVLRTENPPFSGEAPAPPICQRGGKIDGPELLAHCVLKVGHSCRMETRQTEYHGRCYAEWFLHLVTFREGGVCAMRRCTCGVSHREYFEFPSIGGRANLEAKMVWVLDAMGEVIHRQDPLPGLERDPRPLQFELESCSENFSPAGLKCIGNLSVSSGLKCEGGYGRGYPCGPATEERST
ncbi:hypothetical protein DFH07DRAFT_990489 [Mycena maculata]|uniref:Uncharacterized protein n=1 Tax=Mycena maculata TaxID=230809 RepID=A0AAD7I2V7_9AGAR|nr:hypothetical protein DFH07DRAFT_990489 [Mycena maculata]